MDSDPWQRWRRRILPAMLFTFGALLVVRYLFSSSSPTVAPRQMPTLRQDRAQASPTATPGIAQVAPREGPPNSTPTQTPIQQQDGAQASPPAMPRLAEMVPREGPPSSTLNEGAVFTYRVISGDTLTGIAARFNVPINRQAVWIQDTMCLNGIIDADILISGQELRWPTPDLQAVAESPSQKRVQAIPTQVSPPPTPRAPAPITPSPTATPRKTPLRPGTPTRTPTPRPTTTLKSPSR